MKNLFRPWTAAGIGIAILGSFLSRVSMTDAFVNQYKNQQLYKYKREQEVQFSSTFLEAQHKHRSTDRYSSTTTTSAKVAQQVSNLYTNGHCYQKTIKKVSRAEDSSSTTSTTNKKATIPPNKLLNELNRYPALILNADYQPMSYLPLSVCHWQEAIKLIFSGKVAVVDVYEGVTIRAASLEIPLPSVVALNEYVPQCSHKPAFTRRNVFLRDEYTCQYCKTPFATKELSLDHVIPRSMGGRLTWDNAVTSCLKCNGRKGNLLLSDLRQVGMKLHTKPRAPTRHELAMKAGKMLPRKVHSTWQPYLASVLPDQKEDQNRPTLDLEALGIQDPDGEETEGGVYKKKKKLSKNQKKRQGKQKKNTNANVSSKQMQEQS